MNENPIQLFIVAPDMRLVRTIRVLDSLKQFELTRFRSLKNAFAKACVNDRVVLLLQCFAADVPQNIEFCQTLRPKSFFSRFFVYVPDLPKQSYEDSELIRFALLQLGANAVAVSQRELKSLLPAFVASVRKGQIDESTPSGSEQNRDLVRSIYHRLPWNDGRIEFYEDQKFI